MIFQDKFAELERRDGLIAREIAGIHTELLTRRHEFVQQEEFQQFEKRMAERLQAVDKRLDVIEQSRPTAREIEAGLKSKLEPYQQPPR